jgi:autotransporter-associated beta strand protein
MGKPHVRKQPSSISIMKNRNIFLLRTGLITAGFATGLGNAAASEILKDNNTTALNLPASWVGGAAPGATDTVVYDSTVTAGNTTVIGDDMAWLGIRVTNPGGVPRVNNSGTGLAGKTLTLGSGGIDMSSATQNLDIWARTTLSASQTWNVANARSLSIVGWGTSNADGILYDFDLGGFELTKSGPGTLNVLNGYGLKNGTVKVEAGSLQLSANSTRVTGLAADATVIVNGGALSVQNNIATTYTAGGVTKQPVDAVAWNGTVRLAGGRFNISYGTTVGDLNIGGTIHATANTTSEIIYATTTTSTSTSQFRREISAALTGTGTLDFKANNTTRLIDRITLTGDNSAFAGSIRVNGTNASSSRTIRIGAASAGSASAAWTVASANTLEIHGVNTSLGSLSGAGTLRNSSASAAGIVVGGLGTSSEFTGSLENGSGVLSLTKEGAGTLTLSGTNNMTGTTLVSAGTLLVNGSLGSETVSVGANATLGGSGTIAGDVSFDSESTLRVVNLADALTIQGSVVFGEGFGIANLSGLDWDSLALNTPITILDTNQVFGASDIANFGPSNAASVAPGRFAYFETGSLQVIIIPEPSAALLGAVGLLGLLRRRRA